MLYFLQSNIFKLLLWTILIGSSLFYNCRQEHEQVIKQGKSDALAAFEKDMSYRTWSARHGGTYVPITKDTPPNPYLADIKERDITTPSGRKLTLVNPVYMARQVYELAKATEMDRSSHVTSLKPIRPENAPDAWETKALLSFEKGAPEMAEVVQINNTKHLKFMRPLLVTPECLQCHSEQGYKTGQVRGGISVNVNLNSLQHEANVTVARFWIVHGTLWVLGIIFGLLYQRMLLKKEAEIELMNEAVEEKNQEMKLQYENLQHTHKQLRDMHAQVIQASQIASVGLLAADIAHEINHPLQSIKEIQKEYAGGFAGEIVKKQAEAVDKISTIVSELQTLTHPSANVLESVDLQKVLEDTLLIIKGPLEAENVQIKTDFVTSLPKIEVDIKKVQQIFLSLLSNAKDAIKHVRESGVIRIATTSNNNDSVTVTISEGQDQIFRPFYFTLMFPALLLKNKST